MNPVTTTGGDAHPSAWLLLVAGQDRQHGGNDGYADEPDAHYSWDSTVPNHARISGGDFVVLWDKHRLIGASIVEGIEVGRADKVLRRCRACGGANIKARRTKSPIYLCFKCGSEFDEARISVERVTTYRSDHAAGWVALDGLLDGTQLRSLCVSPKSQLSMRALDWDRFCSALGRDSFSWLGRLTARALTVRGGHRQTTVRARLGQTTFRSRLLLDFGSVCAISGHAPSAALEAAHLYSYADLGVHHEHGGLLLRRDIHRLFDDGAISVNPDTLRVDLLPSVAEYEQYGRLQGRRLWVPLRPGHMNWLHLHWAHYRAASAAG